MKVSLRFNAVTLQYLLITGCVAIIAGIGVIFWFAHGLLTSKALDVDHARIDAELAQEEISRLQQLQRVLDDEKDIVKKTAQIVADSQQYNYQNQIVSELSAYAAQAGVEITGYDFSVQTSAPKTAQQKTATKLPNKTRVIIKLKDNLSFVSYLTFLRSLENNVTKMQLSGITVQPIPKNPVNLQGPIIELEVFLR